MRASPHEGKSPWVGHGHLATLLAWCPQGRRGATGQQGPLSSRLFLGCGSQSAGRRACWPGGRALPLWQGLLCARPEPSVGVDQSLASMAVGAGEAYQPLSAKVAG